jgi:hypothetical protein
VHKRQFHLKTLLAFPIMVAPLVLGLGGAAEAQAGSPTGAAAMPADQIVLAGSCVSEAQVATAVQQAGSLYVPGAQPAGLIINGYWVPADAIAYSGEFFNTTGCATPAAGSNAPQLALATDQIAVNGDCVAPASVITAAQDATDLYVQGGAPAGVILNGTWIPAGAASAVGGAVISDGCAVS